MPKPETRISNPKGQCSCYSNSVLNRKNSPHSPLQKTTTCIMWKENEVDNQSTRPVMSGDPRAR